MEEMIHDIPPLTKGVIPVLDHSGYCTGCTKEDYFYAGVFHVDDSTVGLQINGDENWGRLTVVSPGTSELLSLMSRIQRQKTRVLKRNIF
jgi:hypothetical protein